MILARQRVALFVGSGVSASAITRSGRRLSTWEKFLRDTLRQISEEDMSDLIKQHLDRNDYLFAAELIKHAVGNDQWVRLLVEEYSQMAKPSSLQKALIDLDQRLIITTNYDKLLEDAWSSAKPSANRFPTVVDVVDSESFSLFRSQDYHIVKIHGTIDRTKGLTFSRGDYVQNAFGNIYYQDFLRTCFLTHTVLFVGFSMADPSISLLTELMAFSYPSCRPHYIFLGGRQPREIVEISKRMRKLSIMEYSEENDHSELVDSIVALKEQMIERRRIYAATSLMR